MHTEIPPLSEVKEVNDKSLIFLSLISFLEEYNLSSGIQILSVSSWRTMYSYILLKWLEIGVSNAKFIPLDMCKYFVQIKYVMVFLSLMPNNYVFLWES